MTKFVELTIPALIGAAVALIIYFGTQWNARRSAQLSYIQTIFQYELIPSYFSYILWNVHFLSNLSKFFDDITIDDAGLAKINENSQAHRRIVVGILSYVAIQSRSLLKGAKCEMKDPDGIDSFLQDASLIVSRLSNANLVSDFKTLLSSGDQGDGQLRDSLNRFIERETTRIFERTSYMSFLLPFACSPDIRQRIVALVEKESISEKVRWGEVERSIELFLQGKALRTRVGLLWQSLTRRRT